MKLHEEFREYEDLWEAAGASTYTVLVAAGWHQTKSPHLSLDDAITSTKRSLMGEGLDVDVTWIEEQTGTEVFEYDARLHRINTSIAKAETEITKVLNYYRDVERREAALDKFLSLFTKTDIASMQAEIGALQAKIRAIEVDKARSL